MFRKSALVLLGLTASCLIASVPLRAADVEGTLAQKNGWAAYQTGIDRTAAQVDAKCGGRLRAGYDKTSYPQFDPLRDRTQAACQAAVGTLAALCMNDAGKQSVQALAAARCRFSTDGPRRARRQHPDHPHRSGTYVDHRRAGRLVLVGQRATRDPVSRSSAPLAPTALSTIAQTETLP